ncbi:MAG: hypothetical protein ACXVGH_05955, partial [Mycobacteriales bacterium]
KAQLLVQEYEKAGGGYEGERDERQKHLQDWGKQDWQTSEGTGDAGHGEERYLPEVAWKLLTPKERKETDARKEHGDGQFVANTDAAKQARKAAEVLTMSAADARKAIGQMDDKALLQRVRKAESKHGKARKTVLARVDERLADLR